MNYVVTSNGERILKSEAYLYTNSEGEMYYLKIGNPEIEKSGDCYPIEVKGETIIMLDNFRNIVYDYDRRRYVRKTSKHVKGIVSLSPFVKKWFIPNRFTSSYIYIKNKVDVIHNADIIPDSFVYSGHSNCYVTYNNKEQKEELLSYTSRRYVHYDTALYGADNNSAFKRAIEDYKNLEIDTILDTPKIDYSFGVEFETNTGVFPEHKCHTWSVVPVKDGSIRGNEYITVPLKGEKGTAYLYFLAEELAKHTTANQHCSLHIHMGGYPLDKESAVSLYVLANKLQEQIKDIFPMYKKDNRYFESKRGFKDHCKFLPSLGLIYDDVYDADGNLNKDNLENAFSKIFTLFNDGNAPDKKHNFESRRHVKEGKNKWDWTARYYWISFIPYFFKNSKTVEFRYHSGTVNKYKTLNWLFICNALLEYAKHNKKFILNRNTKITLEDVIDSVYGDTSYSIYLKQYISSRRKTFISNTLNDDIYGEEFSKDKSYTFALKGSNMYEFKKQRT